MRPSAVSLRQAVWTVMHATTLSIVMLATILLMSFSTVAEAAPDTSSDVWVVSTRCLGGTCHVPETPRFSVEQCVLANGGRCSWQRAELSDMLAEPARPLVIFIHGNRYDTGSAKQQGLALSRRLARFSPTAAPARTVIFSWPSERQGCLLHDGRAKYQRCYTDGHYLAALLAKVDPEQPVAIVGYSFGALISLKAFDELCGPAGEQLPCGGNSLTCRPGVLNMVLVAPAVRSDALAPRGPYRDALACLDRLTVIINSRDEALRFFPLLDPRVDVPALGYVGMPGSWAAADTTFRMRDATSIVGRQHSLLRYLESATLSAIIATGAVAGL